MTTNQPTDAQITEYINTPEAPRTGFIAGSTFGVKQVQYSVTDGMAMVEGDIVIGTVEEMEAMRQKVDVAPDGDIATAIGIVPKSFRWTDGIIPYQIEPTLPNQQRVTDAIAHWELHTPIRFVQRDASNASKYPNYVVFQPGSGCSSSVGMRGGKQTLTLGNSCSLGNTIHEIGHTVGLWHEQSREDRDKFVKIVWENITSGEEHNFNQHISDGDDIGAYDYGSIMHYSSTAFSKNGKATIIALGGQAIGQRDGLSTGDIAAVEAMYPNTSFFDGVVVWNNGKAYFFKGNQYIRYDIAADKADAGYPVPIKGNWPGLEAFADGIDAVVNWGNGKAYFFKGNQYIRYDIAADKADAGYPLPINGNWPGI